jgi:hypothetical protein
MMRLLKIGMASALALATAAPAFAQYYQPTPEYQRQYQDYQYQRDQYEQSRRNYEDSRNRYQDARADYRAARADYERRLAMWERARASYDARYGYGAYVRLYPRPVWDEAYWARVAPPPPPYAGAYGYPANANVRCDHDTAVGAGVIGAIAGAILGSNVAARNARTEGAVLGGLVGAGVGAAVGSAHDRYRCDQRGPYFSYNETIPYRESRYWRYGSNDYGYYRRMRCRLAAAPVDPYGRDFRYVRVCPDEMGRYRITG